MLEAKTWGVGDAHNASNLQKVQEIDCRIWLEWKLFLTTIAEHVSFVPRNLGFFLSDDHLTKHVAGTEEVLQGNLIRVPPNKRLPEETFFSPPWTENVNPSAFPIPEMIDLAAFCLSDISSDNNQSESVQILCRYCIIAVLLYAILNKPQFSLMVRQGSKTQWREKSLKGIMLQKVDVWHS